MVLMRICVYLHIMIVMILIRNDIMLRVRYVHDTYTYINVLDTCCDTLHMILITHYIIINPNYFTNTYLFIMFMSFGTRYQMRF